MNSKLPGRPTVPGERYVDVVPPRCVVCNVPVRPGRGDPCRCVTPERS